MIRVIVFIVSIGIILFPTVVLGKEQEDERMNYYKRFENVVVPWYYLAAVDQYERNIQAVRIDIPKKRRCHCHSNVGGVLGWGDESES